MTDSKNDSKNAVSHAMDLEWLHSKLYTINTVLWVCNEERLTAVHNSCTQNCIGWWKMRRREWTVPQGTRRCRYTSMVGAGCTRSASFWRSRHIDLICATWAQTCWRSRQSEGLAGRRWDCWRYCCWSAVDSEWSVRWWWSLSWESVRRRSWRTCSWWSWRGTASPCTWRAAGLEWTTTVWLACRPTATYDRRLLGETCCCELTLTSCWRPWRRWKASEFDECTRLICSLPASRRTGTCTYRDNISLVTYVTISSCYTAASTIE